MTPLYKKASGNDRPEWASQENGPQTSPASDDSNPPVFM
jgi:hypothetical protein